MYWEFVLKQTSPKNVVAFLFVKIERAYMNWRRVEIITVLIPKGKKSRETYIIHKKQNTPCLSIYIFF